MLVTAELSLVFCGKIIVCLEKILWSLLSLFAKKCFHVNGGMGVSVLGVNSSHRCASEVLLTVFL